MREMAWYVKKRTAARNFSENEVGIERRGEKDFALEDLKREETRTVRACFYPRGLRFRCSCFFLRF